ncbi:MAG TPA: hypothetical protein ENH11_08175 [Candidatus Acetothermia bacterium]|nr:hypothetical protein [Candidatus Acetothermia bacterium]
MGLYLTGEQLHILIRHLRSFTEPGYAEFIAPIIDEECAWFVEERARKNRNLTPYDPMIREIWERFDAHHDAESPVKLNDNHYHDLVVQLGQLLGVREKIDKRGLLREEVRTEFVRSIASYLPKASTRKEIYTTVDLMFSFVGGVEVERVDELVDDDLRYIDRDLMGEVFAELWRRENFTNVGESHQL